MKSAARWVKRTCICDMTKIQAIGGDEIRLPAPSRVEAGVVRNGTLLRSVTGAFIAREGRVEKRKLTVFWKGTDGETMYKALSAAQNRVEFTCVDPFTGIETARVYEVAEKRASVIRASDGAVVSGDWSLVLEEV